MTHDRQHKRVDSNIMSVNVNVKWTFIERIYEVSNKLE